MTQTPDRTPEAIAQALDDLVKSDGWAILRDLVDEAHGPAAQIQYLDEAMKGVAMADMDAQYSLVSQIRAASKAAYGLLDLVETRRRTMKLAKDKKTITDTFATLRRGPRT